MIYYTNLTIANPKAILFYYTVYGICVIVSLDILFFRRMLGYIDDLTTSSHVSPHDTWHLSALTNILA